MIIIPFIEIGPQERNSTSTSLQKSISGVNGSPVVWCFGIAGFSSPNHQPSSSGRSAASPSKKIGQLLWKQRPRMEFKKYVKPPSVDCGCVHINNYIYTHRYTITYARITDCKCILPTNHEPELWPFWDSYPAPNPNHPFSRDVGRDEIHPEKSPMASQIYPQH